MGNTEGPSRNLAAARAEHADAHRRLKDEKDGENLEGEGGGLDVGSVCSAIESGEISVADMDAILAAIQAAQGATEQASEEEEPAPAPAPGAEIMRGNSAAAVNFAKLQGENDALKARLDARDAHRQQPALHGDAPENAVRVHLDRVPNGGGDRDGRFRIIRLRG